MNKRWLAIGICLIVLMSLITAYAMNDRIVKEKISGSGIVTNTEVNYETTFEEGDERAISNWSEEHIGGTERNDNSVIDNTSTTYEPSSQK